MLQKINKTFFLLVLCLFVAEGICSDLGKEIDQILLKNAQQKVVYSISIVKAQTNHTIYQHNAEKPMIPASNMKIITTAAALHYLTSEFQYSTKVFLDGKTLVIKGSGDPLLSSKQNGGISW